MNYQTKKTFSFKLIGVGLVFLIDYNIGVIDILPDWIGLSLILAGIGKSAYINSHFGIAAKYIKTWIGIAAVKFALSTMEIALGVFNDSDMLMFASVFGLTDLFFSFMTFGNIFSGCEILLNMDGQSKNFRKLDYLPQLLKVFFTARFILMMISQIPMLLSESTYDYLSVKYNTYFTLKMIKDFIEPPCFVAAMLFGMFILSLTIPFFSSISKSSSLREMLNEKINQLFFNDRFFMLKKSLDAAFGFFAAGIIFCIDVEFDSVNFTPDFVTYICLLIGMGFLVRFDRQLFDKKLNVLMTSNLFISVAAYIFTFLYRYERIRFTADVTSALRISSAIFTVVVNILFFAICLHFWEYIKKLRKGHMDFAKIYLHKYMTQAEIGKENINKNQRNTFTFVFGVFSLAKILSYFFCDVDRIDSGIYKFLVSVILFSFSSLSIRYIYKIRGDIYSYYR